MTAVKQDLLEAIETRMPEFSKGQKRIAEYILNYYATAAYMTAAKLGQTVGVSESTVVRFANEMNFDGYPELQNALQKLIRTRLTSVERIEVTNQLIGDGEILEKVLLSDAEKIRYTLEAIDRGAFHSAVRAIVEARRIYILGVRSSATLAGFLNHNMRMIFDNVSHLQTSSSGEMFEQLLGIGEGDVLIAISFPRYSKRIVNAVEFARKRGAGVVAITDSESSPIASSANHLLIAQSDMVSFVDSLVAPLSVINALVAALSREKQEELTGRLLMLERIWDDYEVYEKKDALTVPETPKKRARKSEK